MSLLSEQQQAVVDFALADKLRNLFICGYARTGKTFLGKAIANLYASDEVAFTSTTVIAAAQEGCHSLVGWFNIGLIKDNDDVDSAWARLQVRIPARQKMVKIQTLIADNCGSIPARSFHIFDGLFRRARGIDRPFGGVRVVFLCDPFVIAPPTQPGTSGLVGPITSFIFADKKFLDTLDCQYFFLDTFHHSADPVLSSIVRLLAEGAEWPEDLRRAVKRRVVTTPDEIRNRTEGKVRMSYSDFINLSADIKHAIRDPRTIFITPSSGHAEGINEHLLDGYTKVVFRAVDSTGDLEPAAQLELDEELRLPDKVEFRVGTVVKLLKSVELRASKQFSLKDPVVTETVKLRNGELAVVVELLRREHAAKCQIAGRDLWGSFDRMENGQRGATLRTRDGYFVNCALSSEVLRDRVQDVFIRFQFPFVPSAAINVHKAVGASFSHVFIATKGESTCPGFLYTAISRSPSLQHVYIDEDVDDIFCPKTVNSDVRRFLTGVFPRRRFAWSAIGIKRPVDKIKP
jgi:hypothetical protein